MADAVVFLVDDDEGSAWAGDGLSGTVKAGRHSGAIVTGCRRATLGAAPGIDGGAFAGAGDGGDDSGWGNATDAIVGRVGDIDVSSRINS